MRKINVNLEVELTEGHEERITEACMKVLENKENLKYLLPPVKPEERMQGTA